MDRASKRYKKDLEKHVPYDQMKSRKQAGKLKRSLRKGKGEVREQRVTEDNWEELIDQHGRSRKRPAMEELLKHLNGARDQSALDAEDDADAEDVGLVMSVASGRCRVFHNGEELDCLVPPEVAVRQKSALAVGDRVRVISDGGIWKLQSILPRRTVLARPDPLNKHLQRLVAANVDVVIHVVSVKAPPLRPRLIDRYLIAIQRGGAQPVICVNKIDLLSPEEQQQELARLAPYRDLGVPVVPVSTLSGQGLEELRRELQGRVAALVGHSGVGKSSILNALDLKLQLVTNTLHKRGTGRHTTSASTLYDFGDGTYLIDTPGIREFGLWDLDRESLRDYFPEFAEPSESCRFTNCTHVHEPDCQVKQLVEEGLLNGARYETYVRLWDDLK